MIDLNPAQLKTTSLKINILVTILKHSPLSCALSANVRDKGRTIFPFHTDHYVLLRYSSPNQKKTMRMEQAEINKRILLLEKQL